MNIYNTQLLLKYFKKLKYYFRFYKTTTSVIKKINNNNIKILNKCYLNNREYNYVKSKITNTNVASHIYNYFKTKYIYKNK